MYRDVLDDVWTTVTLIGLNSHRRVRDKTGGEFGKGARNAKKTYRIFRFEVLLPPDLVVLVEHPGAFPVSKPGTGDVEKGVDPGVVLGTGHCVCCVVGKRGPCEEKCPRDPHHE